MSYTYYLIVSSLTTYLCNVSVMYEVLKEDCIAFVNKDILSFFITT